MGLFFRSKKEQSSPKAIIVIRTLLVTTATLFLILAFIDWFNIFYLGMVFIFTGIAEVIDGIEGYVKKENKYYLLNFSFALLLFLLASMYLT